MKCKKCKSTNVTPLWHEILSDGEYVPIGGDAIKPKRKLAKRMKYTSFILGGWNKCLIQYKTYNHCLNCGHANNLKIKTI